MTFGYCVLMNHPITDLKELLNGLPAHLAERTWLRTSGQQGYVGNYVLYWTHHALRADENPALDVAIQLAEKLGLPLLVYQGVSEKYRFASDRHHTFILEAARVLQTRYASLGISYALHVDRNSNRQPRLAWLAKSAAVLVTEDFPLEATKQWTERLAEMNRCPIVLVDTACVVPTRLVGRAFDRAFAFRDATAQLYRERVGREWPTCTAKPVPARLPFDTLHLGEQSLAGIVSQCDIDHSIGPVADTIGGSEAGYARWNAFRKRGLKDYAKRRNQIELDGVSRMSAYLHYGMVSPFRVAREASADGAEKYLDELLIWRELAYAFCYYRADVESLASLPAWAVETLDNHRNDTRNSLSWETLVRARTGERLWDAAQRSLLKHGELHNNIRMTWGKAILDWSVDARQSLERLIDLNHRYALDGRDPASYGGILWCLGQFDRPFLPEQPILGNVRPRPVKFHEHRTNIVAYEKKVDRAVAEPSPRIAMIGTGLAGLMCSRILADQGLNIQCFEKSHRAGGRSSTRIAEGTIPFDHGAQYFTIRSPVLEPYLDSWCQDNHVACWDGRIVSIDQPGVVRDVPAVKRFVGTPNMESLGLHLASDLSISFDTEVSRVERVSNGYQLVCKSGKSLGEFDLVLWNNPPVQVQKLVPQPCTWRDRLATVEMVPCWAVMLAFTERWDVPFDGAFVNEGALGWIARNSSKPSRPKDLDTWVFHSTVAWASENLETSKDAVAEKLMQEAERITGTSLPSPSQVRAHRWLYSRPAEPLSEASLWDETHRLGACGDWCGGPRVEGALLSGMSLAGQVLGSLHERTIAGFATRDEPTSLVQLELF